MRWTNLLRIDNKFCIQMAGVYSSDLIVTDYYLLYELYMVYMLKLLDNYLFKESRSSLNHFN